MVSYIKSYRCNLREIERELLSLRPEERFERFKDCISIIVYRYPQYTYGLGDEICSDFYLFFFPSIKKVLTRFRDRGNRFSTYLFSTIRWEWSRFTRLRNRSGNDFGFLKGYSITEEKLYFFPDYFEGVDGESFSRKLKEIIRIISGKDSDSRDISPVVRKWVFIYILRFWFVFNNVDIEAVWRVLGLDRDWVYKKISLLEECMRPVMDKIKSLNERRNHAFYNLIKVREKLDSLRGLGDDDIELRFRREVFMREIKKYRRAMGNAEKEIKRVKLLPSHRVLAEVLGIPKGTVDSTIFSVVSLLKKIGLKGKEERFSA